MNKKILIAPLNWGIGHATRCIPIINWLIESNFKPIIASDGDALLLLKKEFPSLTFETLPSYNIEYSKKGNSLKWKLLAQTPKILKAIKAETLATELLIDKYKISGIISDNRLGVKSSKIPSVFITHQLNVLSGNTTVISSKLHQKIMRKFDAIWVPDYEGEPNLSGKLGHLLKNDTLNINYIGPLSRFKKTESKKEYDIMVLLSGPEPQRSILEVKLFEELTNYNGKILFVKGEIEAEQAITHKKQFTIYNFMTTKVIEHAINKSEIVICRSGYTSIMDLAKLKKKAFFIPTPGQFEQNYLAERFQKLKILPFASQDNFSLEMIEKIKEYSGFTIKYYKPNLEELFSLF